MNTTRLTGLWQQVRAFLIVPAVFAGGVGAYAASRALWPFLLVWWSWLLAGAAGVVALGAWWLWWQLPKRQAERLRMTVRDAKARTDIEDNFRKTIGQLLGGAAVLIGAGFAYLQFQQQQRSAHDLLISNQVAKGFELLGNKDKQIQQRLGGIYALEGVMNTSKEYYQPVLEALSAFIRDRDRAAETSEGAIGSDIHAALKVIGRRVLLGEALPDLQNARLPKAELSGVNLVFANLNGADLSDANLRMANLSYALLMRANLSDASLWGAQLSGAMLWGANLSGASLYNANLSGAILPGANLSHADLSGANLSGANLTGANLTGTILTGAEADLQNVRLSDVNLVVANLSGANLSGAILYEANLSGAILIGAKLNRANLYGAKGLTQAQLDQACGTEVKGLDQHDPPLTMIKPCPPND